MARASPYRSKTTRLSAEIVKIVNSPDFQQRMLAAGAEPLATGSEEFAKRIDAETAKFAKLVKDGKVVIE